MRLSTIFYFYLIRKKMDTKKQCKFCHKSYKMVKALRKHEHDCDEQPKVKC
jgi:hypothetical protein